jgi:hypothetical protein
MQKILLKKQEVAIRQSLTALELYFQEKDEVSTHTLASAAYNIFRDLAANGVGKTVLMKQESLNHIDKKHHKEWLFHMNKFENFFKHADLDHDKELEFYPGATEFVLWENCTKVIEIKGNTIPLVTAFIIWFTARHYENIMSEENQLAMDPGLKLTGEEYKKMGRKEFFDKKYPDILIGQKYLNNS